MRAINRNAHAGGDELDLRALGTKGIGRGAGSAAAAADKRDLDRRIAGGMDIGNQDAGQGGRRRDLSNALAQLTP